MSGLTIATADGTRELSDHEAGRIILALEGWAMDLDEPAAGSPRNALNRRRRALASEVRAIANEVRDAAIWSTVNAR